MEFLSFKEWWLIIQILLIVMRLATAVIFKISYLFTTHMYWIIEQFVRGIQLC